MLEMISLGVDVRHEAKMTRVAVEMRSGGGMIEGGLNAEGDDRGRRVMIQGEGWW